MTAARDAFQKASDTHYLGVLTASDRLVWTRRGRADIIIDKNAADDAEQSRKLQSLNESDDTTIPQAEPPDPAILTVVVTLTQDDYWLTSCGMWKGPTTAAPHLSDVKPTCTGGVPEHPVFAADFSTLLDNIKHLMEKVKTPGFKATQGILVHGNVGQPKIKFRHTLFEVSKS